MKKPSPQLSEYFSKMGKKGSKARAKKLSPARRKEIARNAIAARWVKAKGRKGGSGSGS